MHESVQEHTESMHACTHKRMAAIVQETVAHKKLPIPSEDELQEQNATTGLVWTTTAVVLIDYCNYVHDVSY